LHVPRVHVHDAGIQVVLGHREAAVHGVQSPTEAGIGVLLGLGPRAISLHAQIGLFHILVPEAADLHRHKLRQFFAEVFHDDTRAAVDIRRILVGKEGDFFDTRHCHSPVPFGESNIRFCSLRAPDHRLAAVKPPTCNRGVSITPFLLSPQSSISNSLSVSHPPTSIYSLSSAITSIHYASSMLACSAASVFLARARR